MQRAHAWAMGNITVASSLPLCGDSLLNVVESPGMHEDQVGR